MNPAYSLLLQGAASLYPYFDPTTGVLNDPVFGCPTQYGTPYFAWVNAVLAAGAAGAERSAYPLQGATPHMPLRAPETARRYLQTARLALNSSLEYLLNPALPPHPSDFTLDTGSASYRNHRDFFWPPVLKTWRLLARLEQSDGSPQPAAGLTAAHFKDAIAKVDILAAFAMRPPSNWAAVWLVGEWARFQDGLSPFPAEQLDSWLGAYFHSHVMPERGFYQEPGHPNSYDLFTRVHLADMLQDGYSGRWLPQMEVLLQTGLQRSLAVQLSDGALASAHRSTGQSWTDGAQISYFTHTANYFAVSQPHLAAAAREAAARAFASLARWQRPDGVFSPVHNLLPSEMRVGYEHYTADGHYSTLALAFLASALASGFDPAAVALSQRQPRTFIENDPIWRAVLHHGELSLQVNAFPAEHYDAFGITDLTFGPDRVLQFASSVHHLSSGRLFNPGLALRNEPGLAEPAAALGDYPALIGALEQGPTPASLRLAARPRGAYYPYHLEVQLDEQTAQVREATPGRRGYRTLLIPYLYDAGTGQQTRLTVSPGRIELSLGDEVIAVEWQGAAERVFTLTQGFENRRGLCALARVDLSEPGEELRYSIRRVQ